MLRWRLAFKVQCKHNCMNSSLLVAKARIQMLDLLMTQSLGIWINLCFKNLKSIQILPSKTLEWRQTQTTSASWRVVKDLVWVDVAGKGSCVCSKVGVAWCSVSITRHPDLQSLKQKRSIDSVLNVLTTSRHTACESLVEKDCSLSFWSW